MFLDGPPDERPFNALDEAGEPAPVLERLDDEWPLDPVHEIVEPSGGNGFGRLADRRRQEVGPDDGGLRPGEGDGALDGVLQFEDVPRPAIADQRLEGFASQPLDSFLLYCGMPVKQMLGDQRDVLDPFPERRDVEGEDIEPVEQGLPELPLGDERVQILGGGSDDPGVHLDVRSEERRVGEEGRYRWWPYH